MTCIVGIIDKGKVIIGGDSAGVSGLNVELRKDKKVFKVGEFVIGCTTSFRMIQLLQFSFKPPKKYDDTDIFEYMCTSFVRELRRLFKEGGFAEVDKSVEKGGTFLVGWKDRLFCIDSDFQVAEVEQGHDSVGCGASFALGALDILKSYDYEGLHKVERALVVATYRSGGVRPPYTILST